MVTLNLRVRAQAIAGRQFRPGTSRRGHGPNVLRWNRIFGKVSVIGGGESKDKQSSGKSAGPGGCSRPKANSTA